MGRSKGLPLLILLPFLCGGCFLGAAEVGVIAGEVVSAAITNVKAETRNEIAEATTAAVTVVNDNVKKQMEDPSRKPHSWYEIAAIALATVLGGAGAKKVASRGAPDGKR